MDWQSITDLSQLDEIKSASFTIPQLIFKHSTRCSISRMSLSKTERNWDYNDKLIQPNYLDLLQHRNISNLIADEFHVEHQSPQILLIKEGKCIFSATHNEINPDDLRAFLN